MLTNDSGDIDPATTKKLTDPTNGSVVLNPDKTFTYTPNSGYVGQDTFTYEVCSQADSSECSSATVLVTVKEPPKAYDDSDATPVNVPVTIDVLTNDTGDIDPVTTRKLTDPSSGSVVLNPDKTFTYTPNSGFVGIDIFTYEICGKLDINVCSSATVTVTIISGNDDVAETYVDTPVTIDVLVNDTGDIDPATTKKLTDPTNGSVVLVIQKVMDDTPSQK